MDDYLKVNRELWDQLAKIHHRSEFYDVDGFLKGKQTLDLIEIEELPDVSEKNLLHLMCHFGMDTLSLARLGAKVTGVDFSSEAIALARLLARQTGLDATFICSDVYKVDDLLKDTFDIVFTSGGVLTWLPDLSGWGKIISRVLKPGGLFYIREFHPFSCIFDDDKATSGLRVRYPYFQGREPLAFDDEGSYADRYAETGVMRSYQWNHPISRIINALISHGLKIEFLHEFPFISYKALPFMIENEQGRWVLPDHADSVPLMFSLLATKL